MTQSVLVDVTDGVAHLTLNRPGNANSLDLDLAAALLEALESVNDDPEVRVVLLAGSGRIFCGGGDVGAMAAAPARGAFVAELARVAHAMIRQLCSMDKVVVTAVQGSAAGAGLSLVLCSDLVVASTSAKFIPAYASVGLTPDCGQSWLLPRVIGLGRALDLMLENRRVTAADALTLGLVSHVVDDDEVGARAESLAFALASGPAEALGHTRRLLRAGLASSFDAHLDEEQVMIGRMADSDDAGRLIDAFAASQR